MNLSLEYCNNLFKNFKEFEELTDITLENYGISCEFKDLNYEEDLPLIIYIGGYCCYSAIKKLGCSYCKELLIFNETENLPDSFDYLNKIDRGRLLYPNEIPQKCIQYNLVIFNKLCNNSKLLNILNKRKVLFSLTLNCINDYEFSLYDECPNNHSLILVKKMIV